MRLESTVGTMASVIDPTFVDVKDALARLSRADQHATAIALAKFVLPFGDLSGSEQPVGGLRMVADAIVNASSLREVDLARRQLFDVPSVGCDTEPQGLGWYSLRATTAWIYTADAISTSPNDGLANIFICLDDLFDQADSELGSTSLASDLRQLLVESPRLNIEHNAAFAHQAQAAAEQIRLLHAPSP